GNPGEERWRNGPGPIKSTPITMAMRSNLDLWEALAGSRAQLRPEVGAVAERIEQDLRQHGASFVDQISRRTGVLRSQLEQGLADLVAAGRLTSDSFTGLRALLTPDSRKPGGHSRHRKAAFGIEDAGRWSLLHETDAASGAYDHAKSDASDSASNALWESPLDSEQLDR